MAVDKSFLELNYDEFIRARFPTAVGQPEEQILREAYYTGAMVMRNAISFYTNGRKEELKGSLQHLAEYQRAIIESMAGIYDA